jgi:hypothetical protein
MRFANAKRAVIFAGIAIALACAGVAMLLPTKSQVAVLTNGHRLTLEKVTLGTNHVFSDHPRLLDLVFKTVPPLGGLFHLTPRVGAISSRSAICLWLSEFNTQSNLYVRGQWQAVQVVDEHGCIIYACDRGYDSGEGPKKIRSALLTAWPRHQEQFTVNIFDQFYEGDHPIATFTVRNPRCVKPPAETAANRLPTEVVTGPLTVRLTRIAVHRRALRPPWFEPKFEFFEQGKRSPGWRAEEVAWSDSSGNTTGYSGDTALCLHDPVWKLSACVFKNPEAQFPSQNVWALPAIQLPGPGRFSPLSFSTNLQGGTLSILGIAGPGRVVYSHGVPVEAKVAAGSGSGISVHSDRIEVECETHHLALDCVGLGRDQRVDLRCRQLPTGKAGADMHMNYSAGTCQFYWFKVDPDTTALQVEAIVQTGHRVEFAVKPPTK